MILDVGCGSHPRGDVNVDLFPEGSRHRSDDQRKFVPALDVKRIPNFVKADACCLPFRDGVFEKVVSCHVLEHVDNPVLMLRELVRVSSRVVVVRCPFWLGDDRRKKVLHRHSFNKRWFVGVLSLLGFCKSSIVYSSFVYFPHFLVPVVRVPSELRVVIKKNSGNYDY